MRLPLTLMLILLIVSIGVDLLIFRSLRRSRHAYPWAYIYSGTSAALIAMLLGVMAVPLKECQPHTLTAIMWFMYTYASVYITKTVLALFYLLSLLPRLTGHRSWPALRYAGMAVGAIIFSLMWWGVSNRHNINVSRVSIHIQDMPPALEGLTIAQISDLHLGSWGTDTVFVSHLVDTINSLHPDLIVFTGDIVNRRTDELIPFVSTLSRLHAPLGIYSILGNHDYGDYSEWPSETAKLANMQLLYDLQAQMGWNMLNNTHVLIPVSGDTLCLVGVENVGDPPFHTYGDLGKSYPTPGDNRFKILLSHNPAHWHNDIRDQRDMNFALTLSGHTHAMQAELCGISPAALRYDEWGGLYIDQSAQHQLYVNIGAGTVGIPARIGATPQVSLLTLTRSR